MRVLTSAVLVMEAIVLGLAIPVALVVGDHPGWVGALLGAVALVCLLLPGLFGRPYYVPVGWALQGVVVLTGVLVPMMFVLGVTFAGLWFTALWMARRTEAGPAAG